MGCEVCTAFQFRDVVATAEGRRRGFPGPLCLKELAPEDPRPEQGLFCCLQRVIC